MPPSKRFWLSVSSVARTISRTLSGVLAQGKRTGNLPTDNAIGRKPRIEQSRNRVKLPDYKITQLPNLILEKQNGGSCTVGRINRRPVASGSGGPGQEAGSAFGRVGGGSGSRDGCGRRWRSGSGSGRREDRIHRGAERSRRQQDQCNQG